MSIGGYVSRLILNEHSGELELTPTKQGESTGQPKLRFDYYPKEITYLLGEIIWGGDSSVMLGQTRIGTRITYTTIEFFSGFADLLEEELSRRKRHRELEEAKLP